MLKHSTSNHAEATGRNKNNRIKKKSGAMRSIRKRRTYPEGEEGRWEVYEKGKEVIPPYCSGSHEAHTLVSHTPTDRPRTKGIFQTRFSKTPPTTTNSIKETI